MVGTRVESVPCEAIAPNGKTNRRGAIPHGYPTMAKERGVLALGEDDAWAHSIRSVLASVPANVF